MIVAVGSTNPTKIEPVLSVFQHYFKDVLVEGINVDSGVSEQPKNDDETFLGAKNRAKAALKKVPKAEFGIGIEGGLELRTYGWFEKSIVVIANRAGKLGTGSSGGLILPNSIIGKIAAGKNLEESIDELFGTTKIGKGIGMFGVMTKGLVTRTEGVRHGVAFALARFLHEDIYDTEI